MEPFLDALDELNSRLDVGLVNADYGNYVGDISVAYNDIPFRRLPQDCVFNVGVPAENAFNEYIKAQRMGQVHSELRL